MLRLERQKPLQMACALVEKALKKLRSCASNPVESASPLSFFVKGFGVRLEKLLITPVFASGPLFINSCFSYCGQQNATKQGKCESTSTASSWWTVDSLTLEGHRGHRCDRWSCRFPIKDGNKAVVPCIFQKHPHSSQGIFLQQTSFYKRLTMAVSDKLFSFSSFLDSDDQRSSFCI